MPLLLRSLLFLAFLFRKKRIRETKLRMSSRLRKLPEKLKRHALLKGMLEQIIKVYSAIWGFSINRSFFRSLDFEWNRNHFYNESLLQFKWRKSNIHKIAFAFFFREFSSRKIYNSRLESMSTCYPRLQNIAKRRRRRRGWESLQFMYLCPKSKADFGVYSS